MVVPGLLLSAAALAVLAHTSSLVVLLVVSFLYGLGFAAARPGPHSPHWGQGISRLQGVAMGTFAEAFDLGVGAGSLQWGFVSQVVEFIWMYIFAGVVSLLALVAFAIGSRLEGCRSPEGSL